ncbi:hypothetical protein ACHAXM_001506 [Skeletonema potamos]
MGIQGLLRNLHPLLVPPPTHHSNRQSTNDTSNNNDVTSTIKIQHNIRQFANKSLAIDASSWLHKAGYTCSSRLVESIESNTRDPQAEKSYTDYMIRRCESLLRDAKISSIYLVFDGVRVPLKRGTNADREEKRQANLAEARRLLSLGRRKEADEKYKLCVKGTEMMARVVCAAVQRKWGKHGPVKCIFAPYEADSQLAKLCVDGLAHAVVTEDSDVLVYSAVCRRPFPVIYKLDKKDGSCDVVTMDWLLNDKFLTSAGVNGGRRRRRDAEEEEESDSEDDSSAQDQATTMQVGQKKVKVASSTMSDVEKHPSEIDYGDDNNMMFAPIRRTLPLPSSGGNGRGRSKGGGSELLSYLRAFANREVTTPGAGVRLFVQACVLSGCDYVANNLSKVGPIGAFKLVKENAHRDPTVRFERILRGAKILAEPSDNGPDNGDDDVAAGDDFLDSLFQSASDDQRKEKYEELLSQSEAVFYYHLVKEVDTEEIVPLVAHKSEDDSNNNLEVGEKFKPCLKRFESGLAFVGSATDAMKRCHEPAPPIQESNGGWMTTAKGRGFNNDNNNKPANNSHRQATAVAAVLPLVQKKTSLDKFLASSRSSNLSSNKPTGMSFNQPATNGSKLTKKIPLQSIPNNDPYPYKTSTTGRSANKKEESNPFVHFAHDDAKPKPSKTPVNTRSKSSDKNATSPFFSPSGAGMNFDYGVLSASKPPEVEKKISHEKPSDGIKSKEDNVAIEPLALDDNGIEPTLLDTNKREASMVVKHNFFDYEVVTESPPRPRSRYFGKAKGEEGLPRRISSSPPEHYMSKSKQIPSESVDIIDLVDDSNEENILNERKPNSPAKSAPKKPSALAINRTFKCPYTDSSNRQSQSTKRKASAILAGFERQKEICEPRKRPIGHLLGQKKSVASKSIVTKRPAKPSSLKQFFGGKT